MQEYLNISLPSLFDVYYDKNELLIIYKTLDRFNDCDDHEKLNEELKCSEKKLETICAQSEDLNAEMLVVVNNLKKYTLH